MKGEVKTREMFELATFGLSSFLEVRSEDISELVEVVLIIDGDDETKSTLLLLLLFRLLSLLPLFLISPLFN